MALARGQQLHGSTEDQGGKEVSLLLHSVQGLHYLTRYRDSCLRLYNIISLFAHLGLNSFREHASGQWKAKGQLEHFADLPRHFPTSPPHQHPPPHQSTSSWDVATSYHQQTGWGTGPGEPAAESVGLLPTGSHYCAALPQIHSRWVSSYGLALESLSNKNTSLLNREASTRPPTNERGARGLVVWFFFLLGLFGILSQSQTDVCKI